MSVERREREPGTWGPTAKLAACVGAVALLVGASFVGDMLADGMEAIGSIFSDGSEDMLPPPAEPVVIDPSVTG